MDHNEIYVAHIGTSIMHVGTETECNDYRASLPYATDCWKINTLEEFGEACYDDGCDSGFDSGVAQSEHGSY